MIVGDILERNARCFPNDAAIVFEGHRITHAQLARSVRKWIHALHGIGCSRQDRIAILSRNRPEYIDIYGAAALGGFVGVGINYRLSAGEQARILKDAQPRVLVFEAEYQARVEQLRAELDPSTVYIALDNAPPWALSHAQLMEGAADLPPPVRARPEDTLFIIYTSGTTGVPKGAMLGNEAQLEQSRTQALTHCAAQTDRMLVVMPFYHIGGTTEVLTYLVAGATIVLHRTFDARAVLASMEQYRVTAAHLAPTMIAMLLDVQEQTPFDVSSLHTVCYASAPMSVALSRRAQAVFGPVFMQAYGMTEAGLGTALLKHQHVLDGPAEQVKRLASAGQPYLGTDLKVVRDDGTPCETGEIGEVWMRSRSTMQGYWRRPEATAEALVEGGFLRTGDMGSLDEENFLFIVDRKKDMIISGGENVYSREVEEALMVHESVAEAAVIGAPDPKWGETVVAFIAPKPGHQVDEAGIEAHCRIHLAGYKRPRIIRFVEALPRIASTNKVDKRALRQPFWRGQERQVS